MKKSISTEIFHNFYDTLSMMFAGFRQASYGDLGHCPWEEVVYRNWPGLYKSDTATLGTLDTEGK